MRERLPLDDTLSDLVGALRVDPTLVLEAPPGAGKTTRFPIAFVDAGVTPGSVLVLEPRRIAARLAARRVSFERGERPGETVGWRVRFEDVSGPKTRLHFLTEGVLVRRLLSDPNLEGVSAVFLDEFHERHLEGDLALALLRRLQARRSDLRLVVMSATLDATPLAETLGARLVRAEGRRFHIAIEHDARDDRRRLSERVAGAVKRLVREGLEGDVLVFLPGAREIREAEEACREIAAHSRLLVLPLHGSLPLEEQERALQPAETRKVILATNVAETSVTVPGVVVVVDSGFARIASHDPWSGIPVLKLAKVSRASATQRTGRAGRTAPGRCLRLYTQADFEARPEHDVPEIRRADLAELVLQLAATGTEPESLDWLEPPPATSVASARELLKSLGALDPSGITSLGRRMLSLPVHPRLGRLVLEAETRGAGEAGALVAALLSERVETSTVDLLALKDQFSPRRQPAVEKVRKDLAARLKPRERPSVNEDDAIRIATLAAFPDRVARRRRGDELLLARGGSARLSGTGFGKEHAWVVAVDAEERREAGGRDSVVVRLASAIEPEWLLDLFPDAVREESAVEWNEAAERVEVRNRLVFGALVLDESEGGRGDEERVTSLLREAALARGPRAFCEEHELDRLFARVELVREPCGRTEVTALTEDDARTALAELCSGRRSFTELREARLIERLQARSSGAARALLSSLAPESVDLPRRRSVRVRYERGKPPWIASRLQDFFGMTSGPAVGGGRIPLVLHLLAPNQRAVQVTTDLAGFWKRSYPAIRKELSRKYPKHAWPEDPVSVRVRVARK